MALRHLTAGRAVLITASIAAVVAGSGLVAAELMTRPVEDPGLTLSSLETRRGPGDVVPARMLELFSDASDGKPIESSFRHQGHLDGFDVYIGRAHGGEVCVLLTTGSEYTAGCGAPAAMRRRAAWVRLGNEDGDEGVAVVIPDQFAGPAERFAPGHVHDNAMILTGARARQHVRADLTDDDGHVLTVDVPYEPVDEFAPVPPSE